MFYGPKLAQIWGFFMSKDQKTVAHSNRIRIKDKDMGKMAVIVPIALLTCYQRVTNVLLTGLGARAQPMTISRAVALLTVSY